MSTPVVALASNHDEMPVGISRQNSANVGIEPDSLDPDINNENNGLGGGGGSEPEPRSESSNAATTSEGANAASTSSQPAPASTSSNQNVKNGGVSKKPRSRHRQKRHTHSDKRYHSEVKILDFFTTMKFNVQSLTKAIIFELFYYINGYIRVWLTSMNIHSKCHTYLLYFNQFFMG